MYQKYLIIGNLTRDPELKYLPTNNTPVANFTVACTTKYGQKEETLFMDCVTFGKQAEVVDKYLSKGLRCLVEGRIVKEEWEKDGEKRSKYKVITNDVKFLSAKKNSESAGSSSSEESEDGRPF